jgi:undecaprenyl diphosphate synthase
MADLAQIDRQKPVPRHVAIIMDGNGRWARAHRLEARLKGHEAGAEAVRAALRACAQTGIEYLTLYAFSTENWKRPADEVQGLMKLLQHFLRSNLHELHEQRVRLRAIGRLDMLPAETRAALEEGIAQTAGYTARQLILALSYGARQELADALRAIAAKVQRGELAPAQIDEQTIAAHLYAPDVPDPDLMIRTSGELRISNFLLWQLSYAELYVTPVLWPDFREADLYAALVAYQQRSRRFGDV